MSLALAESDCPCLPRGVRVVEDRVRGGQVLLGPEKAVALDAIGTAILARVDGNTALADIVADLAATYDAPAERIADDVQRFLGGLRARMFVQVAP